MGVEYEDSESEHGDTDEETIDDDNEQSVDESEETADDDEMDADYSVVFFIDAHLLTAPPGGCCRRWVMFEVFTLSLPTGLKSVI